MLENSELSTGHKDVVIDVCYDHYGRRIATVSRDKFVRIWDLYNEMKWKVGACWKAHDSSILRVVWAHPEFGQIIATAGSDNNVTIWEEVNVEDLTNKKEINKEWRKCKTFMETKGTITDIEFAPKLYGLSLSTCTKQGVLHIYGAFNAMNLKDWTLQHEIIKNAEFSCLSWNSLLSDLHPPMIAVGTSHSVCTGSKSSVFLFEYLDFAHKWTCVDIIKDFHHHINDVSFAPDLGRPFQMLAVASDNVRIYKISQISNKDHNLSCSQVHTKRFNIENIAMFNESCYAILKLSWNVSGTILTASDSKGFMHTFQSNYKCLTFQN